MDTHNGIETLYSAWKTQTSQITVLQGNQKKIKSNVIPLLKKENTKIITETIKEINLKKKVLELLVKTTSEVLQVPKQEIEVDAEFVEYGLDTPLISLLIGKISYILKIEIETTSLLAFSTLREISQYISKEHNDLIIKFFQDNNNNGSDEESFLKDVKRPKQLDGSVTIDHSQEETIKYLKKLLSTVLKIPVSRIDAEAPMEKYGIDSIMVIQLTNQLENAFGNLPKTLFFEYQNIKDLSGYFVSEYNNQLTELFESNKKKIKIPNQIKSSDIITDKNEQIIVGQNRFVREIDFSDKTKRLNRGQSIGDIAIVGVSGKYPGADTLEDFWKNLREGVDSITEIPKDRWDHSLYYDPDMGKTGKTYSKWGGFVNDIDKFDPLFFNISPKEAAVMDPQERLFLECVSATFEDAGYTRSSLANYHANGLGGSVGVFAGVMYEEYQLYGAQETAQGKPSSLWGISSSIANRVSYYYDLHGPSLAVDTMCSSSLTAIHLACQSIEQGDCELAIAGGVNLSVHPNKYIFLSQGRFVSGQGRCESFGEGGDGYVPGEGVGAVLLKPLAKAIDDGDQIYGVIKSSSLNHGGKTNGYSVPNPIAQAEVIAQAFKKSGIDPRTVSYLEAHGTGTSLGDPIEIAGLSRAFASFTKDKQYCSIGSAKSNIGHCESAAGIAGLTKVLLQIKHSQLVPSLHSKVLNPHIDFENSPFLVQQELSDWKRPVIQDLEYPLRAGISSFGAGGSNAHLIVEEYRGNPQEKNAPTTSPYMIVLSAGTQERLRSYAEIFSQWLQTSVSDHAEMVQIAHMLQTGREAMEVRMGILVEDRQELIEKLEQYLSQEIDIDRLYLGNRKDKDGLWMLGDEDIKAGIDTWINKGKYEKLLEIWAKGYDLDWSKFYVDRQIKKISLPTYPFARERHWFKEKIQSDLLTLQDSSHFMVKDWKECSDSFLREAKGQVLILINKATKALGIEVSSLLSGSFLIDSDDSEPSLEPDWEALDGVIDLIGCAQEENSSLEWLTILQTAVEQGNRSGIRLLCTTESLEAYRNDQINLSGATRSGLYRMLSHEYGHVSSCHLDVESGDLKEMANIISKEYACEGDRPEVCFRSGVRYEPYLKAETLSPITKPTFPNPEDVILITGGTRGIGYLCAEHFIKVHGARQLVLSGRSEIPERQYWPVIKKEDSSLSTKIKAIEKLEALGAKILVTSVDLTNQKAVKSMLSRIKNEMGTVTGVVHSAGIIDSDNPAFIRKKLSGIAQVLSPKVHGLETLYSEIEKESLKFFVLFSSVSATIPSLGPGQSDYTMANAYMDYFALSKQKEAKVISIQWPSWKEIGIGEIKSKAYLQTGLQSLLNKEGLELLDNILTQDSIRVVLPAMVKEPSWNPEQLLGYRIKKDASKKSKAKQKSLTSKEVNKMEAPTPLTLITGTEDWLTTLFSEELKMDPNRFEKDRPFQDYGVDSVLLSQLLSKLNSYLEGNLDPSILLEYQSIEDLASWLAKEYTTKLSERLLPASDHKDAASSLSKEMAKTVENKDPETVHEKSTSPEKDLKPKTRTDHKKGQSIAVVGMSCRFPGANDLEEYWDLLKEGRCTIDNVPFERW
ncbi:SDR family NAD(P)-dependent oxidoreductase, partial [Flavivirga jejuensis]|uniref:SDR family NAD(P)-dependent oxidoreductase n=1 Tax=Flavivirga jejuensis TaxID=870487 RepID=UPI0026DF1256